MRNDIVKNISNGLLSLYIFYANLLLGWQLVSFIYLYQTTNLTQILNRQLQWLNIQPYLIGVGAAITIILLIVHRLSPLSHLQHISGLPKQVLIQNIFLMLLFFNYLSTVLHIHLELFELVAFLFSLWVLKRWGSVFFHSKLIEWRHPTTHGSFYVSGFLTGTALLSLFHPEGIDSLVLYIVLVILLVFDLFIVFARFQYLSRSGELTKRIARNLMGRNILFFGLRVIMGIFMPLVFILYMILFKRDGIQGVEILILTGSFLDKYLYFKNQT